MDEFVQGLLVFIVGVLLVLAMLFPYLAANHRWDVGRDKYLMSHCKLLVQQFNSQSGNGTKEFNCKEQ